MIIRAHNFAIYRMIFLYFFNGANLQCCSLFMHTVGIAHEQLLRICFVLLHACLTAAMWRRLYDLIQNVWLKNTLLRLKFVVGLNNRYLPISNRRTHTDRFKRLVKNLDHLRQSNRRIYTTSTFI